MLLPEAGPLDGLRGTSVGQRRALVVSPLRAAVLTAALAALLVRAPILWGQGIGVHEAGYAADAWQTVRGSVQPGSYFGSAPGYVTLLSWWVGTVGFSDTALRLFALLVSVLSVLLVLPLQRVLGRSGTVALALLLALSPAWVGITSRAAPDAFAVLLTLAAAGLLASPHLWRWGLPAAGAIAGYAVSVGPVGVWLTLSLLPMFAWVAWYRRRWTEPVLAVLVAVVAAAAGLTDFFTRGLHVWRGGIAVAAGEALLTVALSASTLLLASSLLILLPARTARLSRISWLLAITTLALLAALMLPAGVSATPPAALLWLSALAALAVDRAGSASARFAPKLAVCVVGVSLAVAVELLVGATTPPVLSVPGGNAKYTPADASVRNAMERVLAVSYEQTRLDRTEAVPQGGRGLSVSVDPSLGEYARWYLRELPVRVGLPDPGAPPDVRIEPTASGRRSPVGYVADSTQPEAAAARLFWREDIWAQISPQAGSAAAALKPQYDLLDAPQPGSRPGQFSLPVGIAFDTSGSAYVVDQGNARVQKFAQSGKFVRAWGTRGIGPGQFADAGYLLGPTGVLAARGSVWVADTWNHRIQQFDADGKFLRAWGQYINAEGSRAKALEAPEGFFGPRGIAIGPDGNLYITDTGNKRVVVYTRDGRFLRQWGQAGTGPSDLDEPVGIAVSTTGKVYVADIRNSRVQVFSLNGTPLRRWTVGGWAREGRREAYLALDRSGNLYATDPAEKAVLKFSPEGKELARTAFAGARPLLEPVGLAVAPDGGIYVTDSAAGRVVRLDRLP